MLLLLTNPILNIQWNGNSFHAGITVLGRGGLTMDGTVSKDGSIQGTFDMGDFDVSELGGGAIVPKSFSGSRFVKNLAKLGSD